MLPNGVTRPQWVNVDHAVISLYTIINSLLVIYINLQIVDALIVQVDSKYLKLQMKHNNYKW